MIITLRNKIFCDCTGKSSDDSVFVSTPKTWTGKSQIGSIFYLNVDGEERKFPPLPKICLSWSLELLLKQFSARNSSKYLYPGRQLDLGGFLGGAFLQEWKVESWNALYLVFFLFLLLLYLDHSSVVRFFCSSFRCINNKLFNLCHLLLLLFGEIFNK